MIFLDTATENIIRNALESSELFNGIKANPLNFTLVSYEKGKMLSNICDGTIVLIAKGFVDVYSSSLSGDEVYLSTLSVGDCVGVGNVFIDNKLSTDIVCDTDVEIVLISRDVLYSVMKQDFELVQKFLKVYNKKIQFLLDRIESLTIQSARVKVAIYLLKNQSENKIELEKREKIASFLGISRATFFRELSFLKKNNVIITDKRFLYIKDIAKLKSFL